MRERVIDKIMSGDGLTMDEIIAGAKDENQDYLTDMNSTELRYFRIGLDEGLRLAVQIIKEVEERM